MFFFLLDGFNRLSNCFDFVLNGFSAGRRAAKSGEGKKKMKSGGGGG